MDYKVLVIDKSTLVTNFLRDKISSFGIEVIVCNNGFDGLIKMRNELPDLIIMDYLMSRVSSEEFLLEKKKLKATTKIPVIMTAPNVDRDIITKMAQHNIFKFIPKPIKVDRLMTALAELFNIKYEVDNNPSIIDVHLNDDILFVEVSRGLNKEKISLLKYKIYEIRHLYDEPIMKVLIIFTDIIINSANQEQFYNLMAVVKESTEANDSWIKILSTSDGVNEYLSINADLIEIEVLSDFAVAIEKLGKINVLDYGEDIENIKRNLLSDFDSIQTVEDQSVFLKFDGEEDNIITQIKKNSDAYNTKYKIAVVDDDIAILEFLFTVLSQTGWEIFTYEDGRTFLDEFNTVKPDLVFLDLMMPNINGFEVLKKLKDAGQTVPVIVVTALSQKENILKARQLGARSILSKPFNIDIIVKKAHEILNPQF